MKYAKTLLEVIEVICYFSFTGRFFSLKKGRGAGGLVKYSLILQCVPRKRFGLADSVI